MREIYEQTYAKWSDETIPMLDDRTPRQAIKTKAGRAQVIRLLKMYERGEFKRARDEGREAVSFGFLWDQVGLVREVETGTLPRLST